MSVRVLVSGASGFIGRALCLECLKRHIDVRAALRTARTASLSPDAVVVGDISKDVEWTSALHDVDVVVHLAARVHVMRETVADPLAEFRKVNVQGTRNLAQQAAAAGVKRFVFVSSVKVNGESTLPGEAFGPDDDPAPKDANGISKLEAEQAVREVCRQTGMEFVVIRPSLVYGPGVRGNFQTMSNWIRRGMPLPLGAIDNLRSFIALDNLVDLLVACLTRPAAANQVFMAADGEDVSTTKLLRRVAASCGVPARLVPVPPSWLRWGAAMLGKRATVDLLLSSLVIDASKTRDILDWVPVVSMDEQLRKMAK